MPASLRVRHLAHIAEAEVTFGDLTVFVGPQASGKSLLAQLWKLHLDSGSAQSRLRTFGYVWKDWADFLWVYFGRGYEQIWQETRMEVDDQSMTPDDILSAYKGGTPKEQVFYIPAQRVLSLAYGYGWPLPFKGFEDGTPFVLRQYSEEMRRFLEEEFPEPDAVVFPVERRLHRSLREQLVESVYPGVVLRVDMTRRKQLVLEVEGTQARLPVYSWTAGQREFTPLLLALYWLLPLGKYPKRGYEWVVIEEPEMGLHPRAIVGFIYSLLHLLHRGYKVILTTHSLTVVEWAWLMQWLKSVPPEAGQEALSEYLGLSHPAMRVAEILAEGLNKEIRTYYFRRKGTEAIGVEISSLDAWDANPDIAEWGGLATTTERAHRVLARALAATTRP